jgi:tetratricopeptide (TPR) repeat protein/O-antigen ligase
MTDRWNRIGSGLLEAGWLGCVVGVPLFFSSTVALTFTADKVLLFRSLIEVLALVALLVWLRRPSLQLQPLTLAVGLSAFILTLATLLGRNPSQGYWGSYLRLFGLFTLLHGSALYLVIAAHFRTERQWRRLLGGVALVSALVLADALLQWRGLEAPIMQRLLGLPGFHWNSIASETYRPFATLGNASYLGTFLVFAIAFTLGALVTVPRPRRWTVGLLLAVLGLVLIVNQTRGAWLAVAALTFTFALLAAPRARRRGITIAGVAALLTALLLTTACARNPNAPWVTSNPVTTRLAHFVQHGTNSSGWYRLDMWRRVGKDVGASPASLMLGYGPESYQMVAGRSFVPAYADGSEGAQFMDSTHNILGDALVSGGLLGVAALLAVLVLGVRTGLQGLRRASSPVQRAVLQSALAALVGYVVQGMFLFDHVVTLVYLSLTLGLIAAASRKGWGASVMLGKGELPVRRPAVNDGPAGSESRLKPARDEDPVSHAQARLRVFPWNRVPAERVVVVHGPLLTPARYYIPLAATAFVFVAAYLLPINVRAYRAQALKRHADELTRAGQVEAATEALRAACRLVPSERTYHVALATSLVAGVPAASDPATLKTVFAAAERELRRAIAMDPGDVRSYWPLGLLYRFWGPLDPSKIADGEAIYRRAAALSPRRQRTYWAWGDLLLAEGRRDEALAQYRYALALDPSVAASQRALAQLYVRLGQPEQAEPLFMAAWGRTDLGPEARLSPPQQAAERESLALAFLARGRVEKARIYLAGALGLDSTLNRAREALERLSQRPAATGAVLGRPPLPPGTAG